MANRIKIVNQKNESRNASLRNLKENNDTDDDNNQIIEMIYQGRDSNIYNIHESPFAAVQEPFTELVNSDEEDE